MRGCIDVSSNKKKVNNNADSRQLSASVQKQQHQQVDGALVSETPKPMATAPQAF